MTADTPHRPHDPPHNIPDGTPHRPHDPPHNIPGDTPHRLRLGIAAVLARRGCDWAPVAAAVAVARGARALDPVAFASLLGVDTWTVFALERGLVHPSLAPLSLARVAPEFDWTALGVPVPPGSDAAPRDRHPSARRPARIRVRGP